MIFDYPFIYHCPKCGKEMQVCNIISGNNVGGTLWSDGKREGPMISASSPVYQCDGCGYYYTLKGQSYEKSDRIGFGNSGVSEFDKLVEARKQFEDEGKEITSEILKAILYAYNDNFYRKNNCSITPSESYQKYFCAVVDEIIRKEEERYNKEKLETDKLKSLYNTIDNTPTSYRLVTDVHRRTLFIAELYRETGRFKECLQQLDQCDEKDNKRHIQLIREATLAGKTEVIALEGRME